MVHRQERLLTDSVIFRADLGNYLSIQVISPASSLDYKMDLHYQGPAVDYIVKLQHKNSN